MAEQLGEKTELPTSRKLSEARSRGSIPKSTDLSSAIDLAGGFILVLLLGPGIFAGCKTIMANLLDTAPLGVEIRPEAAVSTLTWTLIRMAWVIAPFLALMFLVAYLAHFIQVGWLFTTKPLEPKLDALNPLNGMQKVFGRRNAVKSIVSIVKLIVVCGVASWLIAAAVPQLAILPRLDAATLLGAVGGMQRDLALWLLALLLIIGIADYAYQRWQHVQELKMTKQEVKEERRSMEGDMETRARRMKMAREMMAQGLRQTVPTADVIVTNPTHFAVALKYDAGAMDAPKVVAKGADYAAFRIRELAAAHGVPIVEKPPLARALYAGVDVGRAISPQFYEAVAEVLAYVYRLKGKAA